MTSRDVLAGASDDFKRLNAAQLQELGPAVPASKYSNARAEFLGMTFQSGREAARAGELVLLEKHGEIFGLRLQVRFPLPGGVAYVADFVYLELVDDELRPVVEDAKGARTRAYINKAKQFKERYGLHIRES